MPTSPTYAFGRDARTNRLIMGLLVLGFAALIAAAISAVLVQRQIQTDSALVVHTLEVETAINAFARTSERAETARRGALISDDASFPTIFHAAVAEAQSQLGRLVVLTQDNAAQQANTVRMSALLTRYSDYGEDSLSRTGPARQMIIVNFTRDPGVTMIRQIRAFADRMLELEGKLLIRRNEVRESNLALFYAVLLGSGVLIVLVSTVTLVLIRRNLAAIDTSRRELRVLNEELESMVDSRTAELQRANAEIQRFAYIVSHDLRSPLVNVMGFTAELDAARKEIAGYFAAEAEKGAEVPEPVRLAVDEDLPESIGFIRSSTQKMDRLINAILRLSREGRRNLAPAPVNLTELVNTVVDTLQHKVQETETTVTVGDLPTVVSDRLAVEQILSNIIENALKYLKPGRPGLIEVTARTVRERVHIDVKDNGRGIDPRDHDRVFDLFRRSGTQDQPGEGIGLAHVRALAYRLGGLVEVASTVDEGSIFSLILPLNWKSGEPDA